MGREERMMMGEGLKELNKVRNEGTVWEAESAWREGTVAVKQKKGKYADAIGAVRLRGAWNRIAG